MTFSVLADPTDETIRVLHVEDDPAFADLTQSFLERERDGITVDSVTSVEAGLDRLAADDPEYDCVVSDYDMPGTNGIEFLERVHQHHPDLPFVLFTGKGSEEVASEAITAGVSDYLQKETNPDQYTLLANRIENLVEQHRSRRALEASQERLSLFVEQSPLGIIEWDTDMTVLGCNAAAEEILGYEEADLVGESYRVVVAEASRSDVDELVGELTEVRGGFHSVDQNVRADGEVITCEWHNRVITDDSGTPVAIFSQFRDVTDREERERELEAIRTRYRLLVENFPDGAVFLFDDDLRYTLAGGQELEAVGLSSTDFEGSTPYDVFPEDIAEETVAHYRRALTGERGTFEQSYQGGRYRIVTLPIRDGDGEVVAGMAVSLNVTEVRRQAAALERQLERMEEFASVVSHDLRNPLDVAAGRLDLAMEECDSEHLVAVERAHTRMRTLVGDLLTLARTGEPVETTEPVELAAVADRSWFGVDTAEATLRVETDRTVRADATRLEQLFENLFRNSVEHGGDSVVVTVGDLDTADGDPDGFYVADDGPGIPPGERETAFEAGYSTSERGTGFGLRIVRQVAETHGWTVEVTESESGGARFEVRGVDVVERGA
ncbi:PAS domain S-box protein [Salinirubellus salinus]|uniref:histidine kinase n=1 Tax=Salinirubellus salinus TaxID=1364945 RepID=A0A9E7R314_9EURY|nr:PAS domain S-box protein [Salinirubellus salinus]UWM54538.1 PAS domain S-box protein [Salinirubellus salinus]